MRLAPAVVDVAAATKRFSTTLAVDALDLQVREGEILALLGPNGAGKTTTVRMLVGILRPDQGSVVFHFDGERVTRPAPADLGYLPEERGLIRDVPVGRTLEYFAVLHGLDPVAARAATQRELERFGLGDRAKERVDRLSKGNQQKVQFLAAVLHRPRLAVLDEPFSGFDPINQQRFVEEIRRLRDEGSTVLLSAHQMDLVEQLADRLVLLDRGRIVLEGTLEDIRARTSSGEKLEIDIETPEGSGVAAGAASGIALDVFTVIEGVDRAEWSAPGRAVLGLRPGTDLGRVLHQLTGAVRITGVRTERERLHEIFLRAVGRDLDRQEFLRDEPVEEN